LIIVDTSGLVAALFPDQRRHFECASVLQEAAGPFLLSPFVIAEADYLIAKYGGPSAELAFLAELRRGSYELPHFGCVEIDRARNVVESYQDYQIGLTDASLVAISQRYRTVSLLTLDERHFRVLRAFRNQPFRILPADA